MSSTSPLRPPRRRDVELIALLPGTDPEATLRNVPRQDRALTTFGRIVDAITVLLTDPEIGRDRFTSGQVAEVAGVSVGTVYRYFTSRVDMLNHVWPDRGSTYLPQTVPHTNGMTLSPEAVDTGPPISTDPGVDAGDLPPTSPS